MADASGADHSNLVVLFTAFDEGGDAIAAAVITDLAARAPELAVHAVGGSAMQAAGAKLLERTVEGGAGAPAALFGSLSSRRRVKTLNSWAAGHRVAAHVAVDAPAANRPIVSVMHASGARVVHLVAPPLWAGGRFRLGRLRRESSMILCTLPFEEEWFRQHNVPARFIGHPAINRAINMEDVKARMYGLPQGAPRVGLLPGTVARDVRANVRLLVDAYAELQARHAGLCGVIVAATGDLGRIIKKKLRVFPTGLHMTTGSYLPVIAWSDLVLVTGRDAALDVMVQRKPMIGVYKTGPLPWLASMLTPGGSWKLMPNLIAEREVVPEFMPHVGGAGPIVKQASRILLDSKNAAIQSEELHRVCLRFANHRPAEEAARSIIEVIRRKEE